MNPDRHIVPLISDYIDGCLAPIAVRQVEEHLARCSPCARELEQWRAILHLVSRHASMSCPIDCAEAVLQRIEDTTRPIRIGGGREELRFSDFGFRISVSKGASCLLPNPLSKRPDPGTGPTLRAPAQNPKSKGLAWTTAVVAIGILLGGWRWAVVTGTPISLARHEAPGMVGVGHSTPVGRDAYSLAARPLKAVDVEAPDRLERAFGRSDSLILASDFAEDER
jgi:hypothetical protein